MEKVIISQEQAKELEAFKALGRNLQDWYLGKYDDNFPDSILHALSVDQMAKALYIGYEIEISSRNSKPPDCCRMCGSGGSSQLNNKWRL